MIEISHRKVAFDCRYYLGDRPCVWHKETGVLCECKDYIPLKGSLAIIKLDAMGDVLRTTCLLPCIANAWPGRRIVWFTRRESIPLLANNPYVAEAVAYGTDALLQMSSRKFDVVVNLDAGKISSALAAMARGENKIGYVFHEDGYVTGTNEASLEWLRMGVFDDMKKENPRTYQEIMCSILEISGDGMRYVLELTEDEKERGRSHLENLGLDLGKSIVGIHTGGGERWALKQWHEERFVALIRELSMEQGMDSQVLLLGGPSEREQNRNIKYKLNVPLFDAGCDNEVRHFASLAGCCSVVICGDSLAMHIALAMGSRVVALFGPTSSAEIELFGKGEKVVPEMGCLACYKPACDFSPNCMDLISVDMVRKAVERQLGIAGKSRNAGCLLNFK
jgi:heptosyltransferase-2